MTLTHVSSKEKGRMLSNLLYNASISLVSKLEDRVRGVEL